ncbi:carbohydrate ABC transporter substrate-binding protein, CUT1 family [Rhizobiales bacterium GAS113]|jgi:multiple sugar transport system substrate-binding protein|nr:carbohydrate ABC transporter substrate-binding protein, CUT1 family [Rhizobiales bacterium GAS113]SED67094.1 carbohydrate ABC transporter substrate-binding protein, CUT1 family [Rhizobiales bacterium GAS188]
MLRLLAFIGAFVASILTLSNSSNAETSITFYHYQSGSSYTAFRKILDGFEAEHRGIKVKDIFSQSEQITAEVQTALAARRPVDIATVIGKNIVYFVNNTPAVPLNADPGKAGFLAEDLPNFLDIGRSGEKVFAVPHAYGTPMLYYNKDMFRAAGLDPETPPRTWDEVTKAAVAIHEKLRAPGFAHLLASMKDYGTMLFVMNAGSPYLSADGSCALFDTPQGIKALQLWQDLVATYKVTPIANDRQYMAAFNAGQLAMFVNSSAGLASTVQVTKGKFELGVGNYPRFVESEARKLPNSGAALMLYAPPGERRDAALALLAYLSRREVSNLWARESGYMPLAKDPLGDPAMAAYVEGFPLVKPVIAQMAETVPTATWGEHGALEAQTIVSNLIDELWAGHKSAAELVPPAVAAMNAAMGCTRR